MPFKHHKDTHIHIQTHNTPRMSIQEGGEEEEKARRRRGGAQKQKILFWIDLQHFFRPPFFGLYCCLFDRHFDRDKEQVCQDGLETFCGSSCVCVCVFVSLLGGVFSIFWPGPFIEGFRATGGRHKISMYLDI